MNDTTPPLLTKQEAAKFLRVSTRTIDRFRALGKLRAVKVGAKALFRESDLQTVVNKHTER